MAVGIQTLQYQKGVWILKIYLAATAPGRTETLSTVLPTIPHRLLSYFLVIGNLMQSLEVFNKRIGRHENISGR